ncbi:MAG: AbrB/MazE/SpoVT family DNA-binding domain-containing protein [Proteobacteria bacterium]|uniref:AbrB/MazE/SpoVT family DNA-binding domain-containing protein n=1 Tax=Rudaea sp. TaxID=2136325 RepID=UPI0032204826|nr:AbrB/MazE/SpoVT family DNA-binding domain-containing protein [Pseudomonadota bacterium]
MKPLHISIRDIGNSKGVVIPKPLLAQLELEDSADLTVENGALVLRKPARSARAGWAQAAKAVAAAGDDALVMGEFGNADDASHKW